MYWTRRFRRRLRRRLSRAKRGEQYKVEDQAGNVVIRLHGDNHFLIVPDFLAGTLLEEVPRGVEIGPGFHPATVINLGGEGRADLDTKISTFSADPEFGIQFLETVILIGQHSRAALASQRITALAEAGCKSIYTSQDSILEGPYFIKGRNIYRTWRLFPDIYDAFQLPTIPDHADPERFVGVTIMVDGQLMVPVPSRLHYPPSRKKPLNGIRLTVKDLIDLKGVKTTGQSRSYAATYGPRLHTANTVARLISLGAIVIGKTKCTQFGSSDQPTADWVDFHCPWNPRGDKYLSPRGSSTGTCVAVAGYLWCDFGVGTDTGGSIRGPASVMGLFALRPTYAEELLSGILLITSNMDTPGLVCRDTKLLHQVSHQLLAVPSKTHQEPDQTSPPLPHRPNHQRLDGSIKSRDPFGSIWRLGKLLLCRARESLPSPSTTEEPPLPGLDQPKKPTILIFPTDYWNQWPENAVKLKMEAAVKSLEAYLGIKRTCLNLGEAWLTHDPCQDGTALNAYLEETFMTFLWRGYYTNFLSFRNDHKEKFGTKPYVHPVIQDCWRRGEKISESDVAKARTTKQVYSTWVRDKILGGDGFNTIMVYPVGDFTPFYRDVYRPDPEDRPQNYKWDEREDHQSSLAGIPSIIIPVGQVAQPSKITGGEQELPVCISLMSGAGTDSLLTGLVHDVAVKGFLPGEVNTGEKAF